jgi:hypothetical protein
MHLYCQICLYFVAKPPNTHKEIDFLLELDNQIVQLIQVSKTIENETTKKREIHF